LVIVFVGVLLKMHYMEQGCTAHGPDPAPEGVLSGPWSRLKNTRNVSRMMEIL